MRSVACRLLPLFLASALAAQTADAPGTKRPRLRADADTNDWQAYFDYGVTQLRVAPRRADDAFAWATRLAPNRAEPLFGRWVAFWMRNVATFTEYLDGGEAPPGLADADTLRERALWRNPLMPRTLAVVIYDRLPGHWGSDALTRGLLFFANGQHTDATTLWGRMVQANPTEWGWLRFWRASAFAQVQQHDSALASLHALVTDLTQEAESRSSPWFTSHEAIYYALGVLQVGRRDFPAAQAAFQQALVQDLGYAPAHSALGEIALSQQDPVTALREFRQALEIVPNDVWFRYRMGVALVVSRRGDSATVVLQDVIAREPLLADAHLDLGRARELAQDPAGALPAYRTYLALASQRARERIEWVEGRIRAIEGRP